MKKHLVNLQKMEEINNPEKQQNLKFIPVLMTPAPEFLHQSTTVHHTFTRKDHMNCPTLPQAYKQLILVIYILIRSYGI